jgi:hypothetical protein
MQNAVAYFEVSKSVDVKASLFILGGIRHFLTDSRTVLGSVKPAAVCLCSHSHTPAGRCVAKTQLPLAPAHSVGSGVGTEAQLQVGCARNGHGVGRTCGACAPAVDVAEAKSLRGIADCRGRHAAGQQAAGQASNTIAS